MKEDTEVIKILPKFSFCVKIYIQMQICNIIFKVSGIYGHLSIK